MIGRLMLVAAFALGAVPVSGSAALDDVRDLVLPDQAGAMGSLADFSDRPVVVIVVTAKRLRNVRAWERDLRARFPNLDTMRVTDVPEDSPATLEQVSAKLRERVPEGVSVRIDLERRWATALELDTSRPNLVLIGPDGEVLVIHRGRHTPEFATEVLDDIGRRLGSP